jgi:hypothetical protein
MPNLGYRNWIINLINQVAVVVTMTMSLAEAHSGAEDHVIELEGIPYYMCRRSILDFFPEYIAASYVDVNT